MQDASDILEVDRATAAAAVKSLNLEDSNRALAEHWLSLWQGDRLPPRAAFHPAKLKPYLPSMILFDVEVDRSVTVRLAGTGYRHILGAELTGQDWIAAAPPSHRSARLGIFSTLARGAICAAHRRIAMNRGDDYVSEEVLLPFAADPRNGRCPVMVHVNFKPEQFLRIKSISQVTGDPIDFKILPLTR